MPEKESPQANSFFSEPEKAACEKFLTRNEKKNIDIFLIHCYTGKTALNGPKCVHRDAARESETVIKE